MPVYDEDDLLPVSALQHLVFCERQCALIYIERVWKDNLLTIEGSHLHDRTHKSGPEREVRGNVVITRGLPLRSFQLGVSGIGDVVEFHRASGTSESEEPRGLFSSVCLSGLRGLWVPFPVEYKRGKPKADECDEVQICAQAMCLEEMLRVRVPEGSLFYGKTQRRHDVQFSPDLRHATVSAALRLHELFDGQRTPKVEREPKCRSCSLLDICRPDITGSQRSVARYLRRALESASRDIEDIPQ